MTLSQDLMNDISKNVQSTLKSKKKHKKTDYTRYSTARLREEIKLHEDNPLVFLEIYSILQVRSYAPSMCIKAEMQLERERVKMTTPVCYGYKHEAYDSEESMINGFQCSYDDLSESEKVIYNMM